MQTKTPQLCLDMYKHGELPLTQLVRVGWVVLTLQTILQSSSLACAKRKKPLMNEVKQLLASDKQFAILLSTGLLSEISRQETAMVWRFTTKKSRDRSMI